MFHHLFGRGYRYPNTRRYTRLPAPWPIKCEPQTEADGRHVTQTQDVSAGGVCVVIREAIPVGSRIRLEVYVPSLNRTIQAVGRVVRCVPQKRGSGLVLGIQFEQIDPSDRTALNQAVEEFYSLRDRQRQRGFGWRWFG